MRRVAVLLLACSTAAVGATADRYPAAGGDITITPLVHASVQIEHAGKVIQIDPWSVGGLANAKPADLILISDDVGHHLDVKAIQQLRKPGAPVVIAANGKSRVPDGIVLANGESTTAAGVRVESIAAYDIKPGAPEHPKGEASGYLVTLGGRRLYFAGVTECVPEVKVLRNIDVAFMPMNIPVERMTPAAAAECTKALKPKVVYVYHYDQDFASRAVNPNARAQGVPGGLTVAQSLQAFREAMRGEPTEVRLAEWYPASADRPRNDLPRPYATSRDWGELPAGVKWAAVTAIEPAPDGAIYVVHRCFANSCGGRSEAPILKYDAAGKLLHSWGAGMFVFPHGATVDRDGNVWVTDARGENGKGHQVFKFDPRGRVLMTLGTAGVSGSGPLFDQPTDVAVAPGGDVFVTDSHRNGANNRVVKFRKDGTFVKEWGRKGSGRGEMSEPHTIAIDSRGRLFVGDRENNRILIFDQEGTLLDEWRQFGRPSGIFITRDDTIYVADSESGPDSGAHELPGIKKGIRIGSAKDGTVTAFIEDAESTTPDHSGAEGVGVDLQGNVYGGVVRRQMLERHVKKP